MLRPHASAYTHSAMIRILWNGLCGTSWAGFRQFSERVRRAAGPRTRASSEPRSHCRSCGRTLAWWENVPLASWLALARPLPDAAGRGSAGAIRWWSWRSEPFGRFLRGNFSARTPHRTFLTASMPLTWRTALRRLIFLWLLVALAVFDAEHLWLPDRLVLPGIGLGLVLAVTRGSLDTFLYSGGGFDAGGASPRTAAVSSGLSAPCLPQGWSF